MNKILCLGMTLGLIISCGKEASDSDGDSTVSNAMTSTYSQVATQANKIGGLAPSTLVSANIRGPVSIATNAFGDDWDVNSTMPDDTTDANDSISVKEWMGNQISEDSVRENGSSISIFGRMTSTLGVFCAIGVAYGSDDVDSEGYPSNGEKTVTLGADIISSIGTQCDFDASEASGVSMTFTVSTPSDTSVYDKKVVLNPPNGGTQTVYFRSNSTEVNVASSEIYTKDESFADVKYLSRTVVELDITNSVLRAEYVSGHREGALANGQRIEFSRILFDEANDEGYIMSMGYEKDSTSTTTEWLLTGKPETDDSEFALSFLSDSLSSATERQMCVNSNNGNNAGTDGTFCGYVSGVSVAGISVTTATALTGQKTSYNSDNYDSISETTDLSFTSSNFATTAFATE